MPLDPNSTSGLLVLPRLRVQNANAISSPLTWGFPSITAFIGLMHALERKLRPSTGVEFWKVGVVCHHFEAQVTDGGYTRSFCLTRNPVDKDGNTAAIVEEGRIHLDITLVFEVNLPGDRQGEAQRQMVAQQALHAVAGMRVAGGSVMPALPRPGGRQPSAARRHMRPSLALVDGNAEADIKTFRRASRQWLPGFALVSRDDLLQAHWAELRKADSNASVLDAWLSLSRLTHRATPLRTLSEGTGDTAEATEWVSERAKGKGWVVPIPVGYRALSELHAAGSVANARDTTTPFCFVESVYSLGQWVSPHRLLHADHMLWSVSPPDESPGLYRCVNAYGAPASPVQHPAPNALAATAAHPQ